MPLWGLLAALLMGAGLVVFVLSAIDRTRDHRVRANLLEPLGLLLMACGFFILVAKMMLRGWFWILQVPYQLVVGWVPYLNRVTSEVQPDPATVVSAVGCLVAVTVGLHLFLRWLATSAGRGWPWKRSVQVLLLVVLLFVSGLAVVGLVQQTGWLIRTPEPLVKDNRSLS